MVKSTKSKKPTGRPTKKTEEVVQKLIDVFKIDWTVEEACAHAWIKKRTYYHWLEHDEEFLHEMEAAKQYAFTLARKTLVKWIQSWDTKSAIEFLKRRDKRYKDKQEIDAKIEWTVSLQNLYDEEDLWASETGTED